MQGNAEQSSAVLPPAAGAPPAAATQLAEVEGIQPSFEAFGTSQASHSLQELPSLTWLGKR